MNEQRPVKWTDTLLNIDEEYEEPPTVLSIGGSSVATLGNFSAVVGKEKSRKTFCITAMVSALLSGKRVLNFTPSIPSDRKKIIYVDTEQGIHHCQKVVRRVRELTGWNKEQIKSRLAFLVLRKY
ncbi:MAG: mobilization protein, partial [Bacteroidales bacterium]